MPSFKTCIFAHQRRADGSYNIKLRIIHNRQSRTLATNLYALSDDVSKGLKIKNIKLNRQCRDLEDRCIDICNDLGFAVKDMDIDSLVMMIKKGLKGKDGFHLDFITYMKNSASDMKPGTASIYISAANALKRYTQKDSIDISEITSSFIAGFIRFIETEPSQRGSNRKLSTHKPQAKGNRARSSYIMRIKTIWNRAKEEFNDEEAGIMHIKGNPFRSIHLSADPPTAKRALEAEAIQRMIDLPPFAESRVQMARDCFLLSFALMGMNSADMYGCKSSTGSIIKYQRQKTASRRSDQAEMRVRIEPEISALANKYRDPSGAYLFLFADHYSSHLIFNSALNKGLKQVGAAIGIPDLTFYAARHSWATIARTPPSSAPDRMGGAGLDKYIVHEGLNHIDPAMKVTDIYLVKNWEILWDANKKVLSLFDWSSIQ